MCFVRFKYWLCFAGSQLYSIIYICIIIIYLKVIVSLSRIIVFFKVYADIITLDEAHSINVDCGGGSAVIVSMRKERIPAPWTLLVIYLLSTLNSYYYYNLRRVLGGRKQGKYSIVVLLFFVTIYAYVFIYICLHYVLTCTCFWTENTLFFIHFT